MAEPAKKKKIKRKSHPWRQWIPKKERPTNEQSRFEKIPPRHRMGISL